MRIFNKLAVMLMLVPCMGISLSSCGGGEEDIPEAIRPTKPTETQEPTKPEDKFEYHKDGEPFDTYRGLVMCGYQGWFGAPGDGCKHNEAYNCRWYHYRESETFEPGVLRNSIDFWPDMTEYQVKYDTPFTHPDGRVAQVYSAYDESTVLLHFKWMQDYGIDGVFMQRFVGEVVDNAMGKDHFDKVLNSAMLGSNQYQRAIAVMYDLGGYTPARLQKVVKDATEIMEKYSLKDRTKQKYYLYENGRPMIAMWGVGFSAAERGYSNQDVLTLIKALNEVGYSVMLGVTTYWREGGGDTPGDLKNLHNAIKAADAIMPWYVGRYGYGSYSNFHSLIVNDIMWCKNKANYNVDGHEIVYAPLCFPGGSALHMQPQYGMINGVNGTEIDPESRRGDGGRYGGKFFWQQIYHCINSGAPAIYVAMFDEIDEGTAIYKVCNIQDVPSNEAVDDYYVVFDKAKNSSRISRTKVDVKAGNGWCYLARDLQIPFMGIEDQYKTDHYLWLTGMAGKMMRHQISMTETVPSR